MALTFLLGGARIGKSALAVRLASEWPGDAVFVATAETRDAEMAERVERHRAERPAAWTTLEAPLDPLSPVAAADADAFLVLDCLTLWISNLLEAGREADAIESAVVELAELAADRAGPTVVVSNEVGLGIVPANEPARRYRDLLGRVNALFAERAERTLLVVAGRALELTPPPP